MGSWPDRHFAAGGLLLRALAPSSSRTLFSGRLWLWLQVPCSLMHAKPCMLQVLLGHLIQWPNTTLCSSGSVLQAFGGPLPNRKCTCIHERQVLSWPAFSGCSARLLGCYSLQSLDGRVGVFSCGMFDIHRSSRSCGGLARFFGIARLACNHSQKVSAFSKYFRPAMGHPI